MPKARPSRSTWSAASSESWAAREECRSTGIALDPSKNPRRIAPPMPVPVKYSDLARKLTGRGAAIGMAKESMNDRWLLARSTPPVSGTFSVPVIVGRQMSFESGATTPWLMRYDAALTAAPRR